MNHDARDIRKRSEGIYETSNFSEIFAHQHVLLNKFFASCDIRAAEKFVNAILRCKGIIFATGVGKSGFIANHMCVLLASTGTRAAFLNPVDALHGDVGNLTKHDAVVVFSKSGGTEELVRLVPSIRASGSIIFSVTCKQSNPLAVLSDLHMHLPLEREACIFDLAPVTSTIVQQIFVNTLAVSLMTSKRLSLEQYALNHPAGAIGRTLLLTVRDVMITKMPTVRSEVSVLDATLEMTKGGVACVFVMEQNTMCGVFTDGDLRRVLNDKGKVALDDKITKYMTTRPRQVGPDVKLKEAQNMFIHPFNVGFLVVTENSCPVGVLTFAAMIEALR